MKRYSVATSCMMESPRNSILWLWPLDKEAEMIGTGSERNQSVGAAAGHGGGGGRGKPPLTSRKLLEPVKPPLSRQEKAGH